MAVVRQRYGDSVRSEVVGEVMRERYVRAITEKELNPAGFPQIEPKVNEEGKDLEFVAVMEVYPQVELTSIEGTDVERPVVSVSEADVDEMIDTLRKQTPHGKKLTLPLLTVTKSPSISKASWATSRLKVAVQKATRWSSVLTASFQVLKSN